MLWSRSFRPYLIDLCMCRLRAIRKDGVLDRVTVLHVFWSWTNSGSVWSCVLILSSFHAFHAFHVVKHKLTARKRWKRRAVYDPE